MRHDISTEKGKSDFARDLLKVVTAFVERSEPQHVEKVEAADSRFVISRTFSVDVPKVGWCYVSYSERKPNEPVS